MSKYDALEKLLELSEKATPGPWVNEGYYKGEPLISAPNTSVAICCKDKTYRAVHDAAFICAARNAIPELRALLADVREREPERTGMLDITDLLATDARREREASPPSQQAVDVEAQQVPMGETLWLIEQTSNQDGKRRFWNGRQFGIDALKAARYPNKDDAEEVAWVINGSFDGYGTGGGETGPHPHGKAEVCGHMFQCGISPEPEVSVYVEAAAAEIFGRYLPTDAPRAQIEAIAAIITKHVGQLKEGVGQQKFDALERQYNELLFAVAMKHKGESRHATALRYIREAEQQALAGGSDKAASPPLAPTVGDTQEGKP